MKLKRFSNRRPTRQLIDAVVDGYVTWREKSFALDGAYRHWKHAAPPERATAFEAYVSAIDREEWAATEYRRRCEAVGALSADR